MSRSQVQSYMPCHRVLPVFFSCHVPYVLVMDLIFQSECSEDSDGSEWRHWGCCMSGSLCDG